MKNKRVYVFVFFFAIIVQGFGQQDPQFTQHMYTILPINPGMAGSAGICASLHYRSQWTGFNDIISNSATGVDDTIKTNPRDIMLTLHAPVKKLHGGLGLTVYNDSYGQQTDITVRLAYSFRMNIGGGVLGIGPSFDLLSRKMGNKWSLGSSADPQVVDQMGERDMYFDVSLGAYFEMQNKWYAGLSCTQLAPVMGGKNVYQKQNQHIYALGGYTFAVPSNPNWELKPCALLKYDLKSIPTIDVTLIADWQNMFWVGASYRVVDAVAILGGARPFINSTSPYIRGLEVAVSYDVNTSQLMRYGRSFGGPEVCVKYCFRIYVPPQVYGYRGTRLLGNRPLEYK